MIVEAEPKVKSVTGFFDTLCAGWQGKHLLFM